jgi:type VI protein secretion system component Hcp
MSNSLAEAYLLIVRESNVPIIGEAVPMPFTGQIELDAWSWDLHNDKAKNRFADQEKADDKARDEKKKAKEAAKDAAKSGNDAKAKMPSINPKDLIRKVEDLQKKPLRSTEKQGDRDLDVLKLIKKAVLEYAEIAEQANDDDDDDKKKKDPTKMTLTFEKGADLSTTPLLYALARGDLIPRCVLTLFHRAAGAPVTLAITMSDVRITGYKVDCEAESAMADVKETWTATYESIDWMYQNRPAASGPNFLTQGTVRVFSKGSKLSKMSPI